MNSNKNIINTDTSLNNNGVLRAVTYNRCSTEEEVQVNALATQVAESKEIVESKGWMCVDQYVELKSGRSTKRRTEYLRLVEDMEYDKFDIIVIKSIDRLMRSTLDWYIFENKLHEYNKKLFIYMEDKFYVPEDAFITGIKAMMAEEYSKELAGKVKNAHKRRQNTQSGFNFVHAPFGWNKVNKNTLEINESEAYYYRLGFAMLQEGKGFHTIAKCMADQGVVNRVSGKPMSETQWRNMLYSPLAHGEVVLRKDETNPATKKRVKLPKEQWIYMKGAIPAIVSEEYQESVIEAHQKRVTENITNIQNRKFSNKGHHLLSGKLKCGCCGASYYRNVDQKSGKETWRCSNKIYFGIKTCNSINVFNDTIIKIVEKACVDFYDNLFGTNEDSIIEETLRIAKKAMKSDTNEKFLDKLKKDLSEQEKKKSVLFNKLMSEVISDEDFKKFNSDIEKKMMELKEKIFEVESNISNLENIEERIREIRREMRENHVVRKAETKELFDKIQEIKIYPDSQLEIVFKKHSLIGIFSLNKIPIDLKDDELFKIRVPYIYKTRYEEEREKNNQRILDVLRDKPDTTLDIVAELLGLKKSYVNTSIKQLKDQNKLYYKRTGEHIGEWVIVE